MQIENDSAEIYVDWKNTLLWKPGALVYKKRKLFVF
jgi:hypothetical protein